VSIAVSMIVTQDLHWHRLIGGRAKCKRAQPGGGGPRPVSWRRNDEEG
jgi:hypothetical protein